MRFVVDAHIPRRLCGMLARRGHDALHTFELPAGNATRDRDINQISVHEQRVVISKDTDFFHSHLLQKRPWKLLLGIVVARNGFHGRWNTVPGCELGG